MYAHNKRAHLWENARALHNGLTEMGFTLGTTTPASAVIAVLLEDQEQAVAMWQALRDGRPYVNMAHPPATHADIFLLTCSRFAEHSSAQLSSRLKLFHTSGPDVVAHG